jgi:hypothetical protein
VTSHWTFPYCSGLLMSRGSIPGRSKRFISSTQRSDRLWGPPSVLVNWDWELFPRWYIGRGVKVTIQPHLVPKLRMGGAISPLPHIHHTVHSDNFTFIYIVLYCGPITCAVKRAQLNSQDVYSWIRNFGTDCLRIEPNFDETKGDRACPIVSRTVPEHKHVCRITKLLG